MKILLLLFILCINYSFSLITENNPTKKIVKVHPKKFGLLLYHNAGKYVKSSSLPVTKKKNTNDKSYTVFAKPFPQPREDLNVNNQSIPNSPYFTLDHTEPHERRSRVKKVLSDYTLFRKKRSADDKDDAAKNSTPQAQIKSKSENRIKRLKSPVQKTGIRGVKKSRSSVKLSGKNESQGTKTIAVEKQDKVTVSRAGKMRNSKTKQSRARNKKHKPIISQKRKIKKKLIQSAAGRLKTLLTNKKVSGSEPTQKRLKGNRSKQRAQKVRNLSKKLQEKLYQAQRNRTSKNRTLRRGGKGPDARRLIAGRDALIEDYPYTISIQKGKEHWCSGAILNPRLIITTANCLWRSKSISKLRVRAGSRHTGHGGQVARIQEVMKHPKWKLRRSPDNDVALAVLDRNIRFSNDVHGVDLPNRVMLPAFDDAWITSWGTDRRDGVFERRSVSLQVYHARLLERDKCNNVTKRFGVLVTENFICLAQTGRRAPCTRDTGAPAVSDGVLWGLASWGIRKLCGTERFPAMFSYLASQSNMDFIVNATHFLMADERFYPFADRYPIKRYPLTTPAPITLPW